MPERKIPGFNVPDSLYKATGQAALDAGLSVSEFMRRLLKSSPDVQNAAIKAEVDISRIPAKVRGGYRERKEK